MTDLALEAELVALGLTAPRVTPDDIEANIVKEYFFTGTDGVVGFNCSDPSGDVRNEVPDSMHMLTFCVLVLKNGFTVTGESACAHPENYNTVIGQKIARQNAMSKIWPLMGYELRTALHRAKSPSAE